MSYRSGISRFHSLNWHPPISQFDPTISQFDTSISQFDTQISNIVKTQTIPEGAHLWIGESWTKNMNLPSGKELCGIWVTIKVTWKTAPEVKGDYTVKFGFNHPNLG